MVTAGICLFMASICAAKAISDGTNKEIGSARLGWGLAILHLVCALALLALFH